MNQPKKHTDSDGTIMYLLPDNQLHREDGPALITSLGSEYWFQFGEHHRLDGPATVYWTGKQVWVFKGKKIPVSNQKDFESYINNKAFW